MNSFYISSQENRENNERRKKNTFSDHMVKRSQLFPIILDFIFASLCMELDYVNFEAGKASTIKLA